MNLLKQQKQEIKVDFENFDAIKRECEKFIHIIEKKF